MSNSKWFLLQYLYDICHIDLANDQLEISGEKIPLRSATVGPKMPDGPSAAEMSVEERRTEQEDREEPPPPRENGRRRRLRKAFWRDREPLVGDETPKSRHNPYERVKEGP
jgi:hypothetical protein